MGCEHAAYNAYLERVRPKEYPSLLKTTYLDHAGTTLYAASLIDACHQDLRSNLYGNPHSASESSYLSTQRVHETRLAVLEYLNADPNHFDVVFTANASASIKLVADCFRDQGFWYGYHKDTHSSVVGVREVASAGSRCFKSNEEVETWVGEQSAITSHTGLKLFAYPAQSNMTGYRPPLSWSKCIRDAQSGDKQTTFVLLDAASYLTSGRLDLSDVDAAPDFVALSFYKIFGYPDLGALLLRKTAFEVMTHRRYFGGGTVDMVTVIDGNFHAAKRQSLHDFLEDGTLPFHNIIALKHAITIHKKIFGSAENIARHTAHLSAWLYERLHSFKHANGQPVVQFYKDEDATYGDPKTQGPIIAFSLTWDDGTYIGNSHVERLAVVCGFQLRSGGVCNPGGIASMLQLSHWELRRNFTEGVRCGDDVDLVGGKPTGTLRVSLGPMSTMSDVVRFAEFAKHFFVETTIPKAPRGVNVLNGRAAPSGVIPMEGCSTVVTLEGLPLAAYKVWDRQWCIIGSESGKVIESDVKLKCLAVNIDLHSEQLAIKHQDNSTELRISLWSLPPSETNPEEHRGRYFDIYNDPDINEWLSNHLGFPCFLARYRQENARKPSEMTTCVLRSCAMRHTNKDALANHYKSHALPFLQKYPFDGHRRRPSTLHVWRTTVDYKRANCSFVFVAQACQGNDC